MPNRNHGIDLCNLVICPHRAISDIPNHTSIVSALRHSAPHARGVTWPVRPAAA
jgi:hypothetical protein